MYETLKLLHSYLTSHIYKYIQMRKYYIVGKYFQATVKI